MRRKWKVADVLVLLLVLGLGAGLLTSAAARVNDTADRTGCRNNLKLLVLGLLNYNDAHGGALPPLCDQGKSAVSGRALVSIYPTLMPYLQGGVPYFDPK